MPASGNPNSKKTGKAAKSPKTPVLKKTAPANGLKAAHMKTAKAAFKNFLLSKILAEAATPKNFLPADKNVAEFQQALMRRNIKAYQDNGPGMTVTVTDLTLFSLDSGEVDLTTLLNSAFTRMATKDSRFETLDG